MKINVLSVKTGKSLLVEDDIDFSNIKFDAYHIRKVDKCHVKASINKYENFYVVDLSIEGHAVLPCAYTLEDVSYPFEINESLTFKNEEDDLFDGNDDVFLVNNNFIELDEIVLSLIVATSPLKIVKKGAKLPESGNGYRVISEETRNKEKEENKKKNSPFSKLDNLNIWFNLKTKK